MSADPLTLGIGGAVIGGMMDKENPLRGAALGGLGGAAAGPMFGAAGSAPGMAGSVGSGITGSMGAAGVGGFAGSGTAAGAAGAGMGGALGSGVGATAGGMSPLALAGGASPLMQAGGGMAALGAEGAGMSGALPALGQAQGGMLAGMSGDKALSMGGQMLMKNEQAKQGQPVMPGVAPPMMRPQFGAPSFMQSAPGFKPIISGLPQNHAVAANPRMRG